MKNRMVTKPRRPVESPPVRRVAPPVSRPRWAPAVQKLQRLWAPEGPFRRFYVEMRSEVKKITWPSREQVVNLTLIVCAVSAAMGAFLGLVDLLFSKFFEFIISRF
jgi:preprotein translocase subunit SecE